MLGEGSGAVERDVGEEEGEEVAQDSNKGDQGWEDMAG